jgi:hypothetical protein
MWLLFPTQAAAQNIAINGDFETGFHSHGWTLFGGNQNSKVDQFQTKDGVDSLCLKRMPGAPDDNGGLEQLVHLVGGETYVFNADIAAEETG